MNKQIQQRKQLAEIDKKLLDGMIYKIATEKSKVQYFRQMQGYCNYVRHLLVRDYKVDEDYMKRYYDYLGEKKRLREHLRLEDII
ncbi:MAG: hypothetical protein AABY22_25740 [Nanoarchaeota archaeon]